VEVLAGVSYIVVSREHNGKLVGEYKKSNKCAIFEVTDNK
jgi:hypothetical protein